MTTPLFLAQVYVKLAGSDLDSVVEGQLVEVEVDDSLFLPAMATLRFNDAPDVSTANVSPLTNANTLAIGKEVQIAFLDPGDVVFKGEITSIEPDFNIEGFNQLIVRAYDKGHRLIRIRKTRVFLQMSDSDVISELTQEAGLSATVDATQVVHDYLLQNNQTNYEFIQERASRVGHVVRTALGTLTSKPLSGYTDVGPTLNFGNELIEFRPRLTSMDQPDSVEVRGWDPKTKAAVSGTGSPGTPVATIGAQRGTSLTSPFGTPPPTGAVAIPVMQTSEAEKFATAIIDSARNGDIQAEGMANGDPTIVAGAHVTVAGVGTLFNGTYLVTRARHSFSPVAGYRTFFESTNGTGETTAALVSADDPPTSRISGPVVGVVTDIDDQEGKLGRVKVKFPWMMQQGGQDVVSWWARMATPMAGNGRGVMFLPEVNDEVLVAFEQGDVRRPYIIGGLWNGSDAPPLSASDAVASGKVKQRVIKSTSGHIITLDDSSSAELISIIDKSGSNKIIIDTANKKITIESAGDIEIKAAQKINVEATSDISVKGQANVAVEAGAQMTLTAKAGMKIDGGAQVEIKGGVVKIN